MAAPKQKDPILAWVLAAAVGIWWLFSTAGSLGQPPKTPQQSSFAAGLVRAMLAPK